VMWRLRKRIPSDHESVFGRIHAAREWGSGSVSGPGSELDRTAGLRRELPGLLAELGVETLLDAGCGDFGWLAPAPLPVRTYIGVEVVPELLADVSREHTKPGRRFIRADITRDRLPPADLVLCRDVLIHFPDRDVVRALANFRRTGARWILTTAFRDRPHTDPIALGASRTLDFEAPPFQFPPPQRTLPDIPIVDRDLYLDKRLALWELSALGEPEAASA